MHTRGDQQNHQTLCTDAIWYATEATLTDTLQAISTAPVYSLERLNLLGSQFSLPAMQALCAILGHSKSLAVLNLERCGLTDDLVCLLVTSLQHHEIKLPRLRYVVLKFNRLIGSRGVEALDKYKTKHNGMCLSHQ